MSCKAFRVFTFTFVLAFASLAIACPANADVLKFSFEGTVDSAFDNDTSTNPDDIFGTTVNIGDSLSGCFIIDTDAPVTASQTGFNGMGEAFFHEMNSPLSFMVELNGVVIEADGVWGASVANDFVTSSGATPFDGFTVGDGVEPGIADMTGSTILIDGAVTNGRTSLQFSSTDGTGLNSADLPTSINLADFDSVFGRLYTETGGVVDAVGYSINSVTVVAIPEPGTATFLFAFIGIGAVRRRP